MNRRKATLGGAAVGVAAGVVGIALLAAPAGAGQAASLPSTTPQALVASMLSAQPPAMSGTVSITSQLGLPAVPGLPELANGDHSLRVWSDGTGKARLSLPDGSGEDTFVDDGSTLYHYDSTDRTVTETPRPAGHPGPAGHGPLAGGANGTMDPASAAKELVTAVQDSSTITVSGTDTVAGRSAYDLLLTPKPTEKTLLREVKVAVDAQTRVPLQVTVLGNNTDQPALQVGFSQVDFGAQNPSLFTFTAPAGSKVEKGQQPDENAVRGKLAGTKPQIVGSGWDTVVVAQLPSQFTQGGATTGKGGRSVDPMSLLRTFGKPVSGTWGSGYEISTNVATAVITTDGRIAAGLVPEQVLDQALGSTK
jgi:outer membrane lipoprotein-sorting protein